MNQISLLDKFAIYEQLALHQRYIDNNPDKASAEKYVALYWPEAVFTVNDLRKQTFNGIKEIKNLYDYAHSVFPIEKWSHSLGWFEINFINANKASAEWRWEVRWKAENQGIVSTGTYTDIFEKRGDVWKPVRRISEVDPNWPSALFQPYIDKQDELFKES